MRIKLCGGRAPVPPPDPLSAKAARPEPKLADYDEMVIQSAIVSHVVGEHPEGVDLATLVAELRRSLSGEHGAAEIEAALSPLVGERLIRVQNGRVYPGAVFGGASEAGVGPGSN